MNFLFRAVAIAATLAVTVSCAGDYNRGTPVVGDANVSSSLKEKLTTMVGIAPDSIAPSPAPGIMEAKWGNNFAYVTADGRYAVFGDMVNIETLEEVTENGRRETRLAGLKDLGVENTIEFAPESPKHTVTVFTDVDCGYCRMLHRQMPEYNAAGIAVRYLFYPRSGPNTESFQKSEAIWCAEDRKAALTQAKSGGEFSGPSDCVNPIKREWELGQKIGLRGTPMIILPNGETIAGYVPPAELTARLESMGAPKQVSQR